MQSKLENAIVDSDGEPIPWYTYPAVAFLNEYDLSGERVFEYGSRYSTLYYAKKVQSIKTVESDEKWYWMIQRRMKEGNNGTCLLRVKKEEYLDAIFRRLAKIYNYNN